MVAAITRYISLVPLHLADPESAHPEHAHGLGGLSCSGVAPFPEYGAVAVWEPRTAVPDEHLFRG
jgi:hypothetical protein